MKKLDKSHKFNDDRDFAFKEEQRGLLSSNKVIGRCSSLDIIPNEFMTEDIAIDYLASIVVEVFLELEKDEYTKQNNKLSGNLL